MRAIITAGAVTAAGLVGLAGAASATSSTCPVVHDGITKTDNGHGTPAEWADLVMHRTTTVCGDAEHGYTVTLTDSGKLFTRPGAGTPNGTGGHISRRVGGSVNGTYHLTVTGGTFTRSHRNVAGSSTEYVRSLFNGDAQVAGGVYSWAYTTRCEKWVDSSANNDGQGAAAGNITGKRCGRPHPSPTGTATPSPTPSSSATDGPSTAGEAPAPTPVPSDLPVTG